MSVQEIQSLAQQFADAFDNKNIKAVLPLLKKLFMFTIFDQYFHVLHQLQEFGLALSLPAETFAVFFCIWLG